MFGLGLPELLVIVIVVLIIFGAGKLPGVMEELGKGINAFKKSVSSDDEGEKKEGSKSPSKKPSKKK